MHSRQLPNKDPNICPPKYSIYRFICLDCHNFYIGCTIRPFYIRIKENTDNNFSLKIETIVRNVGKQN